MSTPQKHQSTRHDEETLQITAVMRAFALNRVTVQGARERLICAHEFNAPSLFSCRETAACGSCRLEDAHRPAPDGVTDSWRLLAVPR